MNTNSNNFIAIQNTLEENSNVTYWIVDFGGKNSITNYYSNLIGKYSQNNINTIYLGKEEQQFDLNYITHLQSEKTNVNIQVEGVLTDKAKKTSKKGQKKQCGNEVEACTLLSNTAKSKALPMLLCSEEDVEGNHSTSTRKNRKKRTILYNE